MEKNVHHLIKVVILTIGARKRYCESICEIIDNTTHRANGYQIQGMGRKLGMIQAVFIIGEERIE